MKWNVQTLVNGGWDRMSCKEISFYCVLQFRFYNLEVWKYMCGCLYIRYHIMVIGHYSLHCSMCMATIRNIHLWKKKGLIFSRLSVIIKWQVYLCELSVTWLHAVCSMILPFIWLLHVFSRQSLPPQKLWSNLSSNSSLARTLMLLSMAAGKSEFKKKIT